MNFFTTIRSLANKCILSTIGMIGFCFSCNSAREYGVPTVSYEFKGTVTDENGLPLENVKVNIETWNTNKSCNTDPNGFYTAKTEYIRPDKVNLEFSKDGYEKKDVSFDSDDFDYKKGNGKYDKHGEKNLNVSLRKKQ